MSENIPPPAELVEAERKLEGINSLDRAAILLMSIGETDAAEVLKHMGPKEVQRVGTAMSSLKEVTQGMVEGAVHLFINEVGGQTSLGIGADDYIRSMQALGEEKASSLIDRILLGGNTTALIPSNGWNPEPWRMSFAMNIHKFRPLFWYLESDQSAEILANFSEKVRLDIMMRIAALDTTSRRH